tara:strand:+ start:81 stop:992 length:912 start_codon:yes stop_codon:yes gene_type:complete
MKIGICTSLLGPKEYTSLLEPYIEKNYKSYCDKNGYGYKCFTEPLMDLNIPQWDTCKEAGMIVGCWQKPSAILEMFRDGYDYVVFTDADMFFIDPDQKVEGLINDDSDIYITGDVHDVATSCTLIVKNSDWSKKFLKMWAEYEKQISPAVYNAFSSVTTHLFMNSAGQTRLIDQPCLNILLASGKVLPEEEWFNAFNSINLFEGNRFRQHNSSTHSPYKRENIERAYTLIHPKLRDHVGILEQSRVWVHANVLRDTNTEHIQSIVQGGIIPLLAHFNSPEDKKSVGKFLSEFDLSSMLSCVTG